MKNIIQLIDLIYFFGGSLFWILGLIAIREFRRLKIRSDLYLAFYFFSIGWILPFTIIFPYSELNPDTFLIYTLGSNLLLPIMIVSMNLFLDYTYGEDVSYFSQLSLILAGVIDGLLLTLDSYNIIPIDSIYGDAGMLDLPPQGLTAFYLIILMVFMVLCRFVYKWIFLEKNKDRIKDFHDSRNLIIIITLAGLSWVVFVLLKRFFTNVFTGLDYLLPTFFYIFTLKYYLKKPDISYFLPNSPEVLILIYKSGLNLFTYDFKSHKIIDDLDKSQTTKNNSRQLLYGVSLALQNVIMNEDHIESLSNISFSTSEIFSHTTQHIHWFLISKKRNYKFQLILNYLTEQVNKECFEELEEMKSGDFQCDKLSSLVIQKFSNIF